MLSTSKKTHGMRQLFSGLTLGLAAIAVAITIVLLAPAAHAMSTIGTSTEQDFLPDGRMYVLRYSERAFTARQDVTFGLSVKAAPTDDNRALPAFNAVARPTSCSGRQPKTSVWVRSTPPPASPMTAVSSRGTTIPGSVISG